MKVFGFEFLPWFLFVYVPFCIVSALGFRFCVFRFFVSKLERGMDGSFEKLDQINQSRLNISGKIDASTRT